MVGVASPIRTLLALPDGQRRLGPFVLVRALGSGGFAPVWLAKETYGDTELRTAAVKLFSLAAPAAKSDERRSPAGAADRGSPGARSSSAAHRRRILDEARALCRVEHPNVVRFYALATDEERGIIGVAMEHLSGETLGARIDRGGKLDLLDAVAVGAAMASALSAVHRAGLVHRDVKPSNVVEANGVYKLIDFGIASAEDGAATPPEQERSRVVLDDLPLELLGAKLSSVSTGATGAAFSGVTGTVGYIAPERVALGAPATPASDLYGLGVVLFECITGALPAALSAKLSGVVGLHGKVLDGSARAPTLSEANVAAPRALSRLLAALLDPDPARRPRSAEAVVVALEAVRAELSGRERALPPEDIGPFRGLARFEESDRDVYFGRRGEVLGALETLRARPLVALIGASGSGKSSLARAAIVPAVREGSLGGGLREWDVAVVTPGTHPRSALVAALEPLVPSIAGASPEQVVAALSERASAERRGILLLVDQMEELATLSAGEEQAWAAQLLTLLGEAPITGVRTMATIRHDLLKDVLALGALGRVVVRSALVVTPLGEAAWSEVVDEGLGAYGYAFEDPKLREQVIADIARCAGAMPLVQFALARMWKRRNREKKVLTRVSFVAMGGVSGAFERHAEQTFEKLTAAGEDARRTGQRILVALSTAEGTRGRRTDKELAQLGEPGLVASIVEGLEQERILVREGGGLVLAHDSLLTEWRRLRGLVVNARDDRALADDLERASDRWMSQRDPSLLWRQRQLASGEDLRDRRTMSLSDGAQLFLRASRRSARVRGLLTVSVALLAVAATLGGGIKYVQTVRLAEANARALSEEAQANARRADESARDARNQQRNAEHAEAVAKAVKERYDRSLKRLRSEVDGAQSLAELRAAARSIEASEAKSRDTRPAASACPPNDPLCDIQSTIGLPAQR